MNAIISPNYYYVLTVAGQSNAMAYGEGLPLPDREDAPHPRIKQLARFAHTHPGGPPCHFNDIIPLTHCPHDVQDMQGYHHPLATNHQTQYGTVGGHCILHGNYCPSFLIMQGFSSFRVAVAARLLPRAARGHIQNGTEPAMMLVVGERIPRSTRFSQQNASRTGKNPHNKFLGVCWMQGEFDLMTSDYASHPQHFNHMVEAFRRDLKQFHSQLNNITAAPWFCGDTTGTGKKISLMRMKLFMAIIKIMF